MIQGNNRRMLSRGCAAAVALCGVVGLCQGTAEAAPGEDDGGVGISKVQFGSLAPMVTESGFISWSIDGLGTLSTTGSIRVNKPAGATVRRAFLASASTGFSGFKIPDGTVSLDGTPITWDVSTLSSISSWNHWAEVTSIVKPVVDSAAAGTVNLTVSEGNSTTAIDGEVLAVIFDDPNQTTINSAIFMFGAQSVGGDNFAIHLSDPIDLTDPHLSLDLSLGISFGFQNQGVTNQFSIVKVNGSQMTQSAGGEDDSQGSDGNGALLTVGGVGDSNANPPPTATVVNDRTDDELYSLIPFVHTGDTAISVFSQNPSNDDNIFFSGLFVGDASAIVGQGIVIGPADVTLDVGETETVTATVQDANGNPVANKAVTFTVNAGPNKGLTQTVTTDASGEASFSYVGSGGVGVDEITATFVDSSSHTDTSNVALRNWIIPAAPSCALTAVIAGPPRQLQITVQNPSAGLQSIEVTDSTNATTVVPPFPQGFKDPLVVTATKTDESQGAHVALSITDVNGTVTVCDPLIPGDAQAASPTSANAPEASENAEAGGLACSMGQLENSHGMTSVFGLGALVGLALVRRRQKRAR